MAASSMLHSFRLCVGLPSRKAKLAVSALAIAVIVSGCSQPEDPLKAIEKVTYHDRNADGKVDLEKHSHPGVNDADWELCDDNYDGRFEKKVLYGVVVIESVVDVRVPKWVRIEPKE